MLKRYIKGEQTNMVKREVERKREKGRQRENIDGMGIQETLVLEGDILKEFTSRVKSTWEMGEGQGYEEENKEDVNQIKRKKG